MSNVIMWEFEEFKMKDPVDNNMNYRKLKQYEELLIVLESRFRKNMHRHNGLEWAQIKSKLEAKNEKLWSLNEMEKTGGQPDVVVLRAGGDGYAFCDCSPESPKGRRSLCYDREA